jgi:large subunit ribosomal protein L3
MSLGILGKKIGMTQIFDSKGKLTPVTIVKMGPCFITQIKSKEKCGYEAVQIGYSEVSTTKKSLSKPELGHLSKVNLPGLRHLKEYKTDNNESYKIGEKLDVSIFEIGQYVKVTGLTIGKGNVGNIKRHKFTRGGMSHGSKHHRLQGSIGSGTSPGRVFPGKRMPGRVGMEQRTISGLEIMDIEKEENLVILKGCIPGRSGNLISIKAQ